MEWIAVSNTVAHWGAKCAIEDNPIPFPLEPLQRGIVNKEDLDGNELRWGHEDAIIDMLDKIAHRRGLGNTLADGSLR
jgi:aldehyde:ferredoxin oxidoreductase